MTGQESVMAVLKQLFVDRRGAAVAEYGLVAAVVGVAIAVASSIVDKPLPSHAIFLGELGLGGEVRPVSQAERRLAEAAKLGMTTAYLSERAVPRRIPGDIEVIGVRTISDVLSRTLGKSSE